MIKLVVFSVGAVFLPVVFITAVFGGIVSALTGGASAATGAPGSMTVADCAPTGSTTELAGYHPDQTANAAVIVAVGKQLNVPEQGQVVAITAAMQESGLRNLTYGDRDSLGLFQQRPSAGWGTPAQILNPAYAATQFYRHLLAVPGWQQMTVNDAAQTVQRSGYPNAYAAHEQPARALVAVVGSANC